MAFNGSGVFLRVRNWVNDAAAGIKIRADRHDTEDDNFASGLTQCITKDGQTTITANLPMAGFKHTGVGAATAVDQYVTLAQAGNSAGSWVGTFGGTADALTATSPIAAFTAYAAGMTVVGMTGAGANTGAMTINVDGLGVKNILKRGGAAMTAADVAATSLLMLVYNGTSFYVATQRLVKTADIQDGQVTLAKLESIAASTIVGNGTGGSAAPTALTAAATYGLFSADTTNIMANQAEAEAGSQNTKIMTALRVKQRTDIANTGASVTNSSNQVLTTSVALNLAFNTESYDDAAYHDNVTNNSRLTIPATGRYMIFGQINFSAGSNSRYAAIIRLNGTTDLGLTDATYGGGTPVIQVQSIANLTAGDYVELQAFTNAGTPGNANATGTIFQIQRMGR